MSASNIDRRKTPVSVVSWGLYNWGTLRGVFALKKNAIAEAEASSGKPWTICSQYFEVHKVLVQKYDAKVPYRRHKRRWVDGAGIPHEPKP